jgi:hypothetical protein
VVEAPSAYAVISDLDHFSIADRLWAGAPRPQEVVSTLPQEEQVARVAQVVRAWLQDPLGANYTEGALEEALRETYVPGNVEEYQEKV